jgi:hypothetical protein
MSFESIDWGDETEFVEPEWNSPKEKQHKHFSECYKMMYPNDPGVYCTCFDWSPEI